MSLLRLKRIIILWIALLFCHNVYPQSIQTLKGRISTESATPLPNASIASKESHTIATSDQEGYFSLPIKQQLPATIFISCIGFEPQEVEVYENHDLFITMIPARYKLQEVVVTASRKSESLSKVPVTIETLSASALRQLPTTSFYDAISTLPGVSTLNSSITFTVYNTRGFQHPSNQRFVQLTDGADASSPELGLPIANAIGPAELDIQKVELIPGASSAIYGLSASNGLLNLITKDPFTHQGLSVAIKTGINNINSPFRSQYNTTASSYCNIATRYAKAWNDKIALKVNIGLIKGYDWQAGDSNDHKNYNNTGVNSRLDPGYDGVNIYGDEAGFTNTLTLSGIPTKVSRTGYAEHDLTDYSSKLVHMDGTFVYSWNKTSSLSYTYRLGDIDAIFTRGNKLKFKDFIVQQHVLQLKNRNFSIKSYYNTENSGNSYNIKYLADALNNAASINAAWNSAFTTAYNTAIASGKTRNDALQIARKLADTNRILPGTDAFYNLIAAKKQDGSWKTGARFLAKGFFWHNEAVYDMTELTKKIAEIQIGADYRYSQVNTNGTFYADTLHAIYSYKFGTYLMASRDLNSKFRIVASVRADKIRELAGQITERIGLIYNIGNNHNIHISYQNGYRLPSFVEAYQYVSTNMGYGVGGIRSVSQPVNIIHNTYSYESVVNFINSYKTTFANALASGSSTSQAANQALNTNASLLKISTFDYLKPEQNQTIDISYKGSFWDHHLNIEANAFGTQYKDFIQTFIVMKPTGGISTVIADAQKILSNNVTAYQSYGNINSAVYTYGMSLGLDYNFYKKYFLTGNINYINLDWSNTSQESLSNGFNTPKLNFYIGFSNQEVCHNLGLSLQYKWTSKTDWKSDFSTGIVPYWQTVDCQISYRIPAYKSTFTLGGTNILNKYYTQFMGGPSIGGFYYVSLTLDGLLAH